MTGRLVCLLLLLCGGIPLCAAADAHSPAEDDEPLWRRIEAAPDAPGAWLDLAVHYCENGQAQAAERIFHLLRTRYTLPAGILELIDGLRQGGCRPTQALPPADNTLQLRLSAGHDSNPNQGLAAASIALNLGGLPLQLVLDPASRPRADQWQAIDFAWLGTGNGWQPFVLGGQRRYRQQTDYNTGHVVAGLQKIEHSGEEIRFNASLLTLGGQLYHVHAQGHWQRPLADRQNLPETRSWQADWHWGVLAGIQHFHRRGEQDSVQIEPRLVGRFDPAPVGHPLDVRLGLGLLLDEPLRERPGGRRHGLDVQLDLRTPLPGGWLADGLLRLQALREAEPYSPLFGQQRRAGRIEWAGLTLSRRIAADTSLSLNFFAQRSRDDLPLFGFDRRQVFVGLEHVFR